MGVSGAVQWWEESQLRFLVLASLVIQYILLASSVARKFPIRSWFRPVIWLAYLGSDAIAIYALATLFNRHRKRQEDGDGHGGSNSTLEVLWAPILLIHLGGQDGITAYNIEDNELWTRHIFTAVSQVTVAVYVFWKSWPVGDTNLLICAIILFIHGIFKCFEKPWALNRASINSLVSSGKPVRRSVNTQKLKIDPLEDFIKKATSPASENRYLLTPATHMDFTPHKLFVDFASPSPDDRIRMLKSFSALNDLDAYRKLQYWLSETFQLLYTKEKISPDFYVSPKIYTMLRALIVYSPVTALGLFYHSKKQAYSEDDVKVTYALICCTSVLELLAMVLKNLKRDIDRPSSGSRDTDRPSSSSSLTSCSSSSPSSTADEHADFDMISQYNIIGFLVRSREHSKIMSIVGFLRCDNFLHQRWLMKSCSSSFGITKSVLKYVKRGWKHHIRHVSSYRKFNDNRGQFTLEHKGCYQQLGWSIEGAFDESVLLWHLATDFCYYHMPSSHHGSRCTQYSCPSVYACPAWCEGSGHHKRAVQCREMSNYMMYLLFVNPEMLMAGTRRNLFTAAYDELKGTSNERDEPQVQEMNRVKPPVEGVQWWRRLTPTWASASPLDGQQQKERELSLHKNTKERQLTQKIIVAVDGGGSPPDGSQQGIIHDAWSIARKLSDLPEDTMWTVIEGVWVEMLCFSAARCRGYLHAKGLATGVEYLTYVWLLQYYMGMETLAAKLQRVDHHQNHRNGGEHGNDPSTSHVRREAAGKAAEGPSSSGITDQEKAADQCPSHGSDDIEEETIRVTVISAQ